MLKATLEQWRMLSCVVKYGGFNQASQSIHKSQSSIHHAVQKLEDSMGVKMLQVTGRKAHLTEAGAMMLKRANYLLDEARKLEAIAAGLRQGTETQLKVAVDEMFPQDTLYQVLGAVSNEFPHLRVELKETILSGGKELLEKDLADIAITTQPITDGFSEELCHIDFLAVTSAAHPLQSMNKVSYEDLKSYRQVVVRDSSSNNRIDSGWLGAEQRWTVSHINTSIDMIKSGFGFAWLPLPLISDMLANEQLKRLPLEHGAYRSNKLYLLFKDADRLGPAARTFLGELRYRSQQLPCAS